jgi:hypothetical protein
VRKFAHRPGGGGEDLVGATCDADRAGDLLEEDDRGDAEGESFDHDG